MARSFGMLALCLMSVPTVAFSEEPSTPIPGQAAFPPSEKCTTNTPCRNVAGEIVRIEESYWIQLPNGQETHIRVKPETKIDSRVKVGDHIAAQLTSQGDAEAVVKLQNKLKSVELPVPSKELGDLR